MTREEAINKVRQMSLPKETMDILEALAPELTMSEDEMMINELQGFLSSFGSDYFGTGEWQKFDDWLEKQKEQKPAEWSDEDEKMIERIVEAIQDYAMETGQINAETFGAKEPLISYINFLRSLCPQHHWKPSEEQ